MARRSPPSITVAMPATASPLPSLIPITPCVSRPIARTSVSLKRIALPSSVAMITSSDPVVGVSAAWRFTPRCRPRAFQTHAAALLRPEDSQRLPLHVSAVRQRDDDLFLQHEVLG